MTKDYRLSYIIKQLVLLYSLKIIIKNYGKIDNLLEILII